MLTARPRPDTTAFSYTYNAGLLSALAGERREARAFLGSAVRLRPDDAEALLQFAAIQRRGGETREAVATYRRAIDAGAPPGAKYEAGLLLEATGETDGALAFYREAAVESETAARRTVLLLERPVNRRSSPAPRSPSPPALRLSDRPPPSPRGPRSGRSFRGRDLRQAPWA